MNIDDLTLKQIKEIQSLLTKETETVHPMLGRRCLISTSSAVHIGDVIWINPDNAMEVNLNNSLRLFEWGELSLSEVARKGIKKGRLTRTGEIMLTNAIEYMPITSSAEKTYVKFIED